MNFEPKGILDPYCIFCWDFKNSFASRDEKRITMTWKPYTLSLIPDRSATCNITPLWKWSANKLVFKFVGARRRYCFATFRWDATTVQLHRCGNFNSYFELCIAETLPIPSATPCPETTIEQVEARGDALFALMSAVREEFLFQALPAAIRSYESSKRPAVIAANFIRHWMKSPLHGYHTTSETTAVTYQTQRSFSGVRLTYTLELGSFCIRFGDTMLAQVLWNDQLRGVVAWVDSLDRHMFTPLRSAEVVLPPQSVLHTRTLEATDPKEILRVCVELTKSVEAERWRNALLPGTPLYPFSVLRLFTPQKHKHAKS